MVLVGSFYPPYLNSSLFSRFTITLCNHLSNATEVFDDGESNARWTIWRLRQEHVESASETHPYLQFFDDLTNFSSEFAFGPTFIRFLSKFSISLIWRVFSCNRRGSGKKLRYVQKFLSVATYMYYVASSTSSRNLPICDLAQELGKRTVQGPL